MLQEQDGSLSSDAPGQKQERGHERGIGEQDRADLTVLPDQDPGGEKHERDL